MVIGEGNIEASIFMQYVGTHRELISLKSLDHNLF